MTPQDKRTRTDAALNCLDNAEYWLHKAYGLFLFQGRDQKALKDLAAKVHQLGDMCGPTGKYRDIERVTRNAQP